MSSAAEAIKRNNLLIGVGNEFRRDDGVGLMIARKFKEIKVLKVSVVEETGEGAALMETWKQAREAIVFDAVYSGAAPGTIYQFEAHKQSIPSNYFCHSTHALSVAQAIELSRALGQLPSRLIVFGIEGKNFDAGVGLSVEVEKAVGQVVECVVRALRG
jgi:hydrogenase maturation protease